MGDFGFTELLVILIIILIIFGPGKLPEIGEALGKAVGNFKRAVKKGEEIEEKKDIEKSLKG
ncbi:twin-arginine translocase TatA/TatE family subunit [Candidatus Poribacteria bacterium]|nr:twin-arginine translocase TatA/TatE family subunit [Candidatus Poribacteria bacterium]